MAKLVFEKYEIIRRIAIGGMGEIFLARQVGVAGFDRLVILKNLLPDLAEEERFVVEFLDEARVAATLNHPNIVSIFEVGKWEGIYFIAMEYIHGESIANIIIESYKQKKRMPPNVAALVIHDAALALDHAHTAKDMSGKPLSIVHRDISPQNIMVREDGVTKVVDFGIAKAANRSTRTMTGRVKGKMSYMSPEQALGDELDGRSDQFALGIVLWEMCVGRRLFKGEHAADTMRKVVEGPIPRLTEKCPGFPLLLDTIAMRMLERDRTKRYPTCRDVASDLGDYLESVSKRVSEREVAEFVSGVCGERIDETTKDLTPTGDNFFIDLHDAATIDYGEQARRADARRRWLIAGLVATLVLVAGLGAWAYLRGPLAGDPPTAGTVAMGDQAAAAAVAPRSEPGILVLETVPPGATVLAGRRVLGTTPVEIDSLATGVQHVLVLEKRDYESKELRVELISGKTTKEAITLVKYKPAKKLKRVPMAKVDATPAPQSPPAPTSPVSQIGFLTCRTTPWATAYLGKKAVGETPFARKPLPVGTHTLRFVNEGAKIDHEEKVIIEPGQVTKLKLTFE